MNQNVTKTKTSGTVMSPCRETVSFSSFRLVSVGVSFFCWLLTLQHHHNVESAECKTCGGNREIFPPLISFPCGGGDRQMLIGFRGGRRRRFRTRLVTDRDAVGGQRDGESDGVEGGEE